jgi:hypothetical protein
MATLSKPEIAKAPVYDLSTIARSMYDSFNKRDLDRAVSAVAAECEFVDQSSGRTMRGPAGSREFMQGWIRAFSDARVDGRAPRSIAATVGEGHDRPRDPLRHAGGSRADRATIARHLDVAFPLTVRHTRRR